MKESEIGGRPRCYIPVVNSVLGRQRYKVFKTSLSYIAKPISKEEEEDIVVVLITFES